MERDICFIENLEDINLIEKKLISKKLLFVPLNLESFLYCKKKNFEIFNFFKTIIFKNSNHLFILNYISVREILSLSLKTIFRGIRIKSKDTDYIDSIFYLAIKLNFGISFKA